MCFKPDHQYLTNHTLNHIKFHDLFILEDIQKLQDLFADAHGIASVITHPDGRPITKPSSFSRFCNLIRTTEKGCINCYQSDSVIGRHNIEEPVVQTCMSGGLWDAGASITINGQHLANWLIGQVRNEEVNEQQMIRYADEIGVDRAIFLSALNEVPVMSVDKFNKIAKMLFAFAKELSDKAYQNLLLKIQISGNDKATALLREKDETFNTLLNGITESAFLATIDGTVLIANETVAKRLGTTISELMHNNIYDFVSHDVAERRRGMVQRAITSGQPVQFEDCRYERIIDNRIYPVVDRDNSIKRLVFIGIDITEQKRMEIALQESEDNFRTIFEHSMVGISVTSIFGRLKTNHAYRQILGYTEEELSHIKWQEITHPESIDADTKVLTQLISGEKESARWEKRYIHKNGAIIWVDITSVIQRDHEGKPLFFITSINDITDRKKVEDELQCERMLLRTMIDNIPDSIYCKDLAGRKTLANTTEIHYSGAKSESEVLGKTDFELYPVEFAEKFFADDQTVMQTGEPLLNREEYVLDEKGARRHLLSSKIPLRDENGRIIGLIGIGRDITERVQAQEQLVLLSRAVDQSPVTVVITDKKGLIEYVNPKFTQVTGYTLNEVKGENPNVLQSGHQSQAYYQKLWDTILSGSNWKGEFKNKKKSGEFYWESAVISPLMNAYGEISFFIAVKEDITEKKKMMEELIRAKEQAEESDRLKSSFLANMSHEIRTPMNGILGFTGLLKEPKLTGEEQQEYIGIIEKSGARMLNIINDIINISKVESGQMDVTISETNINTQIEYIYTFFKPETEQKGIQLSYKSQLSKDKAVIKTDREKLYAILTNLVKNAIKFTSKGTVEFGYILKNRNEVAGRDELKNKTDRVKEDDDRDKACLVSTSSELEFFVKDTGVGIRNEQQGFIFERFRQASESLNRNYEGAGLGLSISKAYVEMLGGKMRLESAEGAGSAFYFTIPYQNSVQEENAPGSSPSGNKTDNSIVPESLKLKILIAEDDEGSAKFISLAIKTFGKEILQSQTGFQAVEICRNHPDIDLILMDIKMPEMDGYEATRQIRQFNKEVIIIAQTAYALEGDGEKAILAGCNDYLSKPIQRERLTDLMQKYFKKTIFNSR